MGSNCGSPGPDASTLDTVDESEIPEGVNPIPMRITYTSDEVSDYVNLRKDGRTLRLELADPLLGIVRKIGEAKDVVQELKSALASVAIPILEHFKATIAEYVNHFLQVAAVPETMGLPTAVYLLNWLHKKGLLVFGHIHQASPEEFWSWVEFMQKAEEHPDINVN